MPLTQTTAVQKQNGNLVFAGTDTEVSIFFNYLKAGRNLETFLEDYPKVKISQVNEVLELAEAQFNSGFSS